MRGIQWRSMALVLAMAMALGACSSSGTKAAAPTGGAPAAGGAVVDLQNFAAGDPTHIDPALADDVQSSQIAELLYDGLTDTTADGSIRNAVAEAVTPSEDAKRWIFRLRNDVHFDNNDVVRASDFKFAWERVADPKLASKVAYHLAPIQGFDDVQSGSTTALSGVVADDNARTLTVTLSTPRQDFNTVVSLPVFSPLPKQVFDAASTQRQAGGSGNIYEKWETGVMVGNGPFRMSKPWESGRAITLARSGSYYGGASNHKAYLDTVEFRISKDVASAYTDFEGISSAVGRIPAGRYSDVKARRGDDVVNTPLLGTEFWAFNMKSPAVGGADNLKLRQAIALATNKKDVVDKVWGGSRTVATSFVPPAMPGYDASLVQPDRNLDRARTLLREWGKTPPALKISFATGANHEDKATILQQNLKEIGITATPDPMDRSSYRKAVQTGAADFFWRNWTADYVSYDNFIAPNFTTASIGKDNVTNYSAVKVDELVKAAQSENDSTIRNGLYREAEKRVLDDQVIIPLDWTTAGMVKSSNVHDLVVKPLGYVAYADTWVRR